MFLSASLKLTNKHVISCFFNQYQNQTVKNVVVLQRLMCRTIFWPADLSSLWAYQATSGDSRKLVQCTSRCKMSNYSFYISVSYCNSSAFAYCCCLGDSYVSSVVLEKITTHLTFDIFRKLKKLEPAVIKNSCCAVTLLITPELKSILKLPQISQYERKF